MKRSSAIVALLAAVLGVIGFFWIGREPTSHRNADIPAVLVTSAQVQDVPIYINAIGTVTAIKTVTVRPQVDGKLTEVNFKEGQDVKAGDTLARIDPAIYQAQYDQAVAKKAQDSAQLENAKIDLGRYEMLAANHAGSQQQAATQHALVAQLDAQVNADQAAIDNQKAILSYTNIVSPIDGRTGLRLVDPGNIVHATDTTGIVVVTQLDPISVVFSIPQQQLAVVRTALAKGQPHVDILRPGEQQSTDSGALNVIDNEIDQTTGTVRLRATFKNDAHRLWPGQYVSLRVEVDLLKNVTVLPDETVQRGPNGTFVFVVDENSKAVVHPVTVTREENGLAIVQGVGAEDKVISTGFLRLADGTRVRIVDANAQNAPAETSAPQGERHHRRQSTPSP